jgi:AGCS family alanine or glycine:cation symporter
MEEIVKFIDNIFVAYNEYVGGYALLIMLVPAGIYFAFKFKFLHVTKLGHAIQVIRGKYDKKEDTGDINHFRALTTALSATVGTGNIVGVALAIYYGGPGAIFWMWITGFLGMIHKFVECTLSFKYRKVHEDGSISGGPMYYMEMGLKKKLGGAAKVMAVVFAIATILCSLGTGNMAQSKNCRSHFKTGPLYGRVLFYQRHYYYYHFFRQNSRGIFVDL